MKKNVLVTIPARFQSVRFPGKPLTPLLNKTMIDWVYDGCIFQGPNLNVQVAVVTDSDQIENHLKSQGRVAIRVDDDVQSGSERCYLGLQRYYSGQKFDYIVNVQGDEPLIAPKLLSDLVEFHQRVGSDIATLCLKKNDLTLKNDPNRVKIAYSEKNYRCLYFSRSPIPFDRSGNRKEWFLHAGVYSYTPEALDRFFRAGPSELELSEGLEQLRALDLGLEIKAMQTDHVLLGVDTPEDRALVEGVLREREGQ